MVSSGTTAERFGFFQYFSEILCDLAKFTSGTISVLCVREMKFLKLKVSVISDLFIVLSLSGLAEK